MSSLPCVERPGRWPGDRVPTRPRAGVGERRRRRTDTASHLVPRAGKRNGQASFQAPRLLVSDELVFEYTTVRNGQVVTETVSVAVQPVETIERPTGYVLDDWEDEADTRVDDDQGEEAGGRSSLLVALLGSFFSMLRINGADEKR